MANQFKKYTSNVGQRAAKAFLVPNFLSSYLNYDRYAQNGDWNAFGWDTAGAALAAFAPTLGPVAMPLSQIGHMARDDDAPEFSALRDYIYNNTDNTQAKEYLNTLGDSQLSSLIDSNYLKDVTGNNAYQLWGLMGNTYEYELDALISDLVNAVNNYSNLPQAPDREAIERDVWEGNDYTTQQYLNEIAKAEALQTKNYNEQLQANQMAFDDYRKQILSNQYAQNAQLMDSVDSSIARTRRNALEAGASAGLRLAENINTTLATQNRQAQISLETSNQLAQQLITQRNAAAGIRTDYRNMIAGNAVNRANYKSQRADTIYNQKDTAYKDAMSDYNLSVSNDTNPISGMYSSYIKRQDTNKQNSLYNN